MGVGLPRQPCWSSRQRLARGACNTHGHPKLSTIHLSYPIVSLFSTRSCVRQTWRIDAVAVGPSADVNRTAKSEKAILGDIRACRSSDDLLDVIKSSSDLLDPINTCAAYMALSQLAQQECSFATIRRHPGLATLSTKLSQHIDEYDERSLCSIAASFHTCRLGPADLPIMLLEALETTFQPDGRCTAMVFRACTASNTPLRSRLISRSLHQVFRRGFDSWDLRSLSMFAAALAKLGISRKDVFRKVAKAAGQRCGTDGSCCGGGLHSLLVLLWAFAKAKRTQSDYAAQLFQVAGGVILQARGPAQDGAAEGERGPGGDRGISSVRPMLIAQCMWAFATAAEARIAARGARAVGAQERRGSSVHTSAADYAGASVPRLLRCCWPEVPVADVMHALMRTVAEGRHSIQSDMTIANMLWAAATLSLYHGPFVAHMEHCAARRACCPGGMGVQPAATCLWALGRLSHANPATSRLLAAAVTDALRAEGRRAGQHAQAVSMAMHACATLACGTEEERRLLRLGQRLLAQHAQHASVQSLTVALWSSCVAEEYSQQRALAVLLQEAFSRGDELNTVELAQLAQVDLALRLEARWYSTQAWLADGRPEDLLGGLYWLGAARNKVAHSWLWRPVGRGVTRLQAAVQTAVEGIGYPTQAEACVTGMSVDVWVPALHVALEVDGPLHFAANRPQHALGATRMKRRLLRRCGVVAVAVPFFEWPQGAVQQRAYVRGKLRRAVAASGGASALESPAEVAPLCEGEEELGREAAGAGADSADDAACIARLSGDGASEAEVGVAESDAQEGKARPSAARVNLMQYQHGRLSKQQLLRKAAVRQIKRRPPK
eukprot:jgi/Ulvmu1/10228/UM060_0029.1